MTSFQESTLSDCYMIDLPTFTDERGSITIVEGKQTSFVCKRAFWLHHINEGKDRGSHALRTSSEIMIAIHGSFVVELSDGLFTKEIQLDNSSKGFFIPSGIWFRTHSFSIDGICLVLASAKYSKDEYICDFNEYQIIKTKNNDTII